MKLPKVERDGAFTRAEGEHLAMLEWALPEGAELDDLEAVKAANPASWITIEGLARAAGGRPRARLRSATTPTSGPAARRPGSWPTSGTPATASPSSTVRG